MCLTLTVLPPPLPPPTLFTHAPSYSLILTHAHAQVIKKRAIKDEEGNDAGFEEYFDYIFPGDEQVQTFKLLEIAKQWKKQKQQEQQ